MQGTAWALLAPVSAILLAILTKEVYISLFFGIFFAALLLCNFDILKSINIVFDAMSTSVDPKNIKIIIFLILLGTIVVLVNKSGGTTAYGRWANSKIKTKKIALLSTQFFAMALFIDDYFSCLTTGNVMKPITDKNKISRAKLTYMIHSTVVPICMLAPISSWAAAVCGTISKSGASNSLNIFLQAIPYNFYCILAILMGLVTSLFNINYSKMLKHEENAENGDLFSDGENHGELELKEETASSGKIIDLLIPIVSLIIFCIMGILLDKKFATDNGLVLGSFISLVITALLYIPRRIMNLKDFLNSLSEGFKEMAPAIIILTLAWTFAKITTDEEYMFLGKFISELIKGGASYTIFIPAILFVLSIFLSVSTGTSWGTFSMLIPIAFSMFSVDSQLLVISIAAILSGSACGDNISPISDTTVMSCTGTKCSIINHISTQLPYALLVASISTIGFLIAGIVQNFYIALVASMGLLIIALFSIKFYYSKKVFKN